MEWERNVTHKSVTYRCDKRPYRRQLPDGITIYSDVFVLAVDPGSTQAAWMDYKHEHITNGPVNIVVITRNGSVAGRWR